ncbi:hypothetical protein JCM1840_000071 [Sporobolomyces johnsonii]
MPPKASGRSAKKTKVEDDGDYDGEAAGGDEGYVDESDAEYEAPKTKKTTQKATATKVTGKATGGKKKKLEVFNAMPLDILGEIMSHLDTKTVLAMSRTCSVFRRTLHSDHGLSVWRQARANTNGIPDLKAGDLKEWEYASLLFDKTCHVCRKGRTNAVDYVAKVRACAECINSNSLLRQKTGSYHPLVWDCVPISIWDHSRKFGHCFYLFWEPAIKKISAGLYAAEKNGTAALDAYIKLCKKSYRLTSVDGKAIKLWEARAKQAAAKEKEDKIEQRVQQIKQKLMAEEGFTAVELTSYAFKFHASVYQPRPLTDAIWKRIKGPLLQLLEAERASRPQHEVPAPPSPPSPSISTLFTDDDDDDEA